MKDEIIKVNQISFNDTIIRFSSPLVIDIKTLEKGIIEISAPEINIAGYGYRFEESWKDFKETFYCAYYIIKYSKEFVSDRSKKIVKFINSSCEEVI